jgi:hypothetical protein
VEKTFHSIDPGAKEKSVSSHRKSSYNSSSGQSRNNGLNLSNKIYARTENEPSSLIGKKQPLMVYNEILSNP